MNATPTIKVKLDALLKYVPTGTTEGERMILREAFIKADEFSEIITPPSGSPRILVGKKGSGKSAIIDFSSHIFNEGKIPNIILKPLDIDLSNMSDQGSVGELTRSAYHSLLQAIAITLGSDMSGLIDEDDGILLSNAIAEGAARPDLISRLANILPKISKPWVQTDLSKILPNASKSSAISLQRAISNNVATSKSSIYIFIDDTDQVAPPDVPSQLNRIWAFLLATRELCQRIPQVRCIVSLRDEIWRALSSEKAGQRDQTDHFLSLVHYLNPSLDHVQEIFEKRFELAAKEFGVTGLNNYYPFFFKEDRPKMPTSQKRTSWPDAIRSRSRERPRDAIQLINALAKRSLHPSPQLIDEDIFALIMPEYSEQRVRLLAQEFEKECSHLTEIIRTFGDIDFDSDSFTSSNKQINDHIRKLPSYFSVTLYGETIHPGSRGGIIDVWSFLFKIGFLFPRVSDKRESNDYRHIYAKDQPKFVSASNWNNMQAALWEVHPAYRDYLIQVRKDKVSSFGLPQKPKTRNRR